MKRKWPTILLLIVFAWLSTGGSFTCFYRDKDNHHDDKPKPKQTK